MPELIITLPDGRVQHARLTGNPATIGRDLTCEIAIDDPSTSRRHAKFVPDTRGYYVEDLGSRNGTLVNDAPCTKTPLRNGDRIILGATLAVYKDNIEASGSVVISDDGGVSRHSTRYVPKDKALALSQRRLEMIYELSDRLTTLQSQADLFQNAMSICQETLQFERGAIGIRRPNSRAVDWPVVVNLRGAEGELTISRSLLSRALDHGERAMYAEGGGGAADPTVSMVQHSIRSAMCVPMIQGDEILGVIYGDRISTSTVYTSEDIDFFAAIARQISIGLINSRLMEAQRQMAMLDHDLDVARGIQNSLFPAQLPERPGLAFAALNDAGRRVSGDYYDVIERPDGRIWMLIADVTGEGVSAALLMANLQAAVRVTIDTTDDPGQLLSRWNALVCRNSASNRFVTCVLVLIDPAKRSIRMGNAGHWAPILLTNGTSPLQLEMDSGLPLGVTDDGGYESAEFPLPPGGCSILTYTDGVIEANNPEGGIFGLEKLLQVLAEKPDQDPAGLVKRVRKEVSSFAGASPQSDDITIVAARLE